MAMNEWVGYSKIYACLLPQMLKEAHREKKRTIAPDLSHRYDVVSNGLLSNVVTK